MHKNTKIDRLPSIDGLLILLLLGTIYVYIPSVVAYALMEKLSFDYNVAAVIASFTVGIIFFIIFFKDIKKAFNEYLHDKNSFKTSMKYWLKGFGLMYLSNIILVMYVFDGQIATNEELNREVLKDIPYLAFFEIALVAPFVEEIIFRYGIRRLVGKNKLFPIISALIFGGLHALTGITSWKSLLFTIPYGALGYMFALSYNETDNIFTSITAHTIHNTVSFALIMLLS